MAYIELCLTLDFDQTRAAPEVRAWVDLDPDGQQTRETELALQRRRGDSWHGTFAIADSGAGCVLYRVALVAHAGAEWSLSMYQRNRGRAILSDRDTLAMAKGWLVGTCELPQHSVTSWPTRATQTDSGTAPALRGGASSGGTAPALRGGASSGSFANARALRTGPTESLGATVVQLDRMRRR